MSTEHGLKRYGLRMSIDGFLRHNRYPDDFDVFQAGDGRAMKPSEALAFLTTAKARGHTVIPCSAECGAPCPHEARGCTGFDYSGGGCPGYFVDAAAFREEGSS